MESEVTSYLRGSENMTRSDLWILRTLLNGDEPSLGCFPVLTSIDPTYWIKRAFLLSRNVRLEAMNTSLSNVGLGMTPLTDQERL